MRAKEKLDFWWMPAHGAGAPPTPPTTVGDCWLDTDTETIWWADGTDWVEVRGLGGDR
jgi:hypothetical protein